MQTAAYIGSEQSADEMRPTCSFQVRPHQFNHVLSQFVRICRRPFGRQQMQPDVVFEHFGHKTVDTAPDVRKQHENVRAIVLGGERALDRINLPANAFDTGNELLLFFIDVRHDLLAYPKGI